MSKGFFVPNSVSDGFVANQQTNKGNFKWDESAAEIGLNQQAVLQNLTKEYNTTINTAYSNYLSANRSIKGTMMGQGYKEAYMQRTEQDLQANLAETNMGMASARNQLGAESAKSMDKLGEQYRTEVGNMDRVSSSMNDYLGYLKTLTNSKNINQTYLSEKQMGQSIDDMYDAVYQAQPQDYLDSQGDKGISYIDWVRTNLKDNAADKAWSEWLFASGGYNQFREATKKGIKSQ